MRPCRYCAEPIENRRTDCPKCGRDNTWPPPADESATSPASPAKPSRQPPADPYEGVFLDLVIMDPGFLFLAAALALTGIGMFLSLSSKADRQERMQREIAAGKLLPQSLRIMNVETKSNRQAVEVGNGRTILFREDLPASIRVQVDDPIEAYEDGGHYFVPAWDSPSPTSMPWVMLAGMLTPMGLLLAVFYFRLRTVHRATISEAD